MSNSPSLQSVQEHAFTTIKQAWYTWFNKAQWSNLVSIFPHTKVVLLSALRLWNVVKFGWRPLLECCAVMLPRRETRWNLQGCPKLANRSQPLVGRSSPYYQDMWRFPWLTSFFPIVDTCLSSEAIARQTCAMVPKWRLLRPIFPASHVQHISHLRSKFALGPHHVWKYGRHLTCGRWD